MLYVIELTIGFETNLNSNTERKHENYYNNFCIIWREDDDGSLIVLNF